ncbi:unnamed protein product [Spirodela intermedia]|uniref:Uncharacterized protein n=1 Tax=Spirodela intermedia TaxID=51605 RepID=A0A7I8K4S6_SPIIN|nr:unnamed protein product [Spirodela intermedia]
MRRKNLLPASTSPPWLQALRTPMKATSVGITPSRSILANCSTASSARPCRARPLITALQMMGFLLLLLGISSNTCRALSMLPHLAYMSTRAEPSTSSTSMSFLVAYA